MQWSGYRNWIEPRMLQKSGNSQDLRRRWQLRDLRVERWLAYRMGHTREIILSCGFATPFVLQSIHFSKECDDRIATRLSCQLKLPARNTKSVAISLFLKFDLARSTTKQTAIRIAVNFICVINEKNLMHFRVSTWGAATFRFKNKEAENKGAFGMITDILI